MEPTQSEPNLNSELEKLSVHDIETIDNEALKRVIQSVRREKEDLAAGISHKDHGSHSNTNN